MFCAVHSCGNQTNYSEVSQQTFMSFDWLWLACRKI